MVTANKIPVPLPMAPENRKAKLVLILSHINPHIYKSADYKTLPNHKKFTLLFKHQMKLSWTCGVNYEFDC